MASALKSLTALAVIAFTLAACGNGDTTNNVKTTTIGEELASLETAYSQGLLSEKEYKQQRKKILDGK